MLKILQQPDDVTCGPTCLHAVYQYFHRDTDLEEVIRSINYLEDGGTLGVHLALDALNREFNATIYSYNFNLFDPTWKTLENGKLISKLEAQMEFKTDKKLREASLAYIRYLRSGGKLLFDAPDAALLKKYLLSGFPVLCGLSATYLYQSKREFALNNKKSVPDDLKGIPVGHFVVLYNIDDDKVTVADPYRENPIAEGHHYEVPVNRLIHAILLGNITYDANMLILSPKF